MRRVMLLAAMLAMVLAAAAPVLAQDVNVETGDSVEYNAVCQNIAGEINAIAVNTANADASAEAGDDAVAIAEIAQDNDLTVAQVNECLNNFETVTATGTATPTATVIAKKKVIWIDGKKFWVIEGKTMTADVKKWGTASAWAKKWITVSPSPSVVVKKTVTATAKATSTAKVAVLPETGGASLLALGAGALLVGGGLVARRIVR